MILQSSLHIDWIKTCTKKHNADPLIIEKVIRALVLLEELQKSGLDFIFKGGTALMLMIQEPRRFSIDIDIIIENKGQDIKSILDIVIANTDFIKWKEQERTHTSKIEKKHFKLYYTPQTPMQGAINNILLDIVFESNPYTLTKDTKISHMLLMEKEVPINIVTPTLSAILGDKLTAYGPNTTGVPLKKPKEIIKQIYDIGSVFDRIDNLNGVKENFIKVAKNELTYKRLYSDDYQLIIDDIVNTSFNFCSSGQLNKDMFKTMLLGVNQLNSFIYGNSFREPQAQTAIAKALYIVKQIENNKTDIDRFDRTVDMKDWKITHPKFLRLNRLKKQNIEAFHYWYKGLN